MLRRNLEDKLLEKAQEEHLEKSKKEILQKKIRLKLCESLKHKHSNNFWKNPGRNGWNLGDLLKEIARGTHREIPIETYAEISSVTSGHVMGVLTQRRKKKQLTGYRNSGKIWGRNRAIISWRKPSNNWSKKSARSSGSSSTKTSGRESERNQRQIGFLGLEKGDFLEKFL